MDPITWVIGGGIVLGYAIAWAYTIYQQSQQPSPPPNTQ